MKKAILGAAGLIMVATVALAGTEGGLPGDWYKYKHIGSLVITDTSHALWGIHHFYINDKGFKAFKKGEKYPDGTIIVDSVYEVEQTDGILNEGKLAFFPVMKKNSGMTETGGWEWAAYGPDGKDLGMDPKECLSCHNQAKDRDYVLSQPLKKGMKKKK